MLRRLQASCLWRMWGSCVVWGLALTFPFSGCSDPAAHSVSVPATDDTVEPATKTQPPAPLGFSPLQLPAAETQPLELRPKTEVVENAAAATRIRLSDDRPELNSARLQQAGIRVYRGQRLVVLSDLPEQQVAGLPQLADCLFDALEAYFGQLPEAADGSSFQVTGHIIGDEEKFRQAALMPAAAFTFEHGKHVNYEFWMFSPEQDYYRRHLMLHEFTHCFMTCESGMNDIPPLWYVEGMAEFFATHRRSKANSTAAWEFGILPEGFDGFEGWGRISEFRRSFARAVESNQDSLETLKIAALSDVMPDTVPSFDSGFQYSSSWALCWFLNHHPLHREAVQALAAFKHRDVFMVQADSFRRSTEPALSIDWLLFAESLKEGFDAQRAFAEHNQVPVRLSSVDAQSPVQFPLLADRGWQDSGLRLERGQTVQVDCSGRCSVNDQPKPWVSEPNGVSIEYIDGFPLGQVIAIFVSVDGTQLTRRIPVGESRQLSAPFESSLWLQINDVSDSRANNSGKIEVTLAPAE